MFDIEVIGSVKNKNKIADICLDILYDLMPKTKKQVDITVKFVKECDSQEAGYCFGDHEEVIITIAKNSMGEPYTLDEQLITLCHELVHAKQIIKKELNGDLWLGKKITSTHPTNTPWEIEAFNLEKVLFEKHCKRF